MGKRATKFAGRVLFLRRLDAKERICDENNCSVPCEKNALVISGSPCLFNEIAKSAQRAQEPLSHFLSLLICEYYDVYFRSKNEIALQGCRHDRHDHFYA